MKEPKTNKLAYISSIAILAVVSIALNISSIRNRFKKKVPKKRKGYFDDGDFI